MKKMCLLLLSLLTLSVLSLSFVSADSALKNAGAGSDVLGVGTISWTSPGNIGADDTSYASATLPNPSSITHYLQGTNYGFAIPSGATINGIEVTINRNSTSAGGVAVRDNIVRLVKASAITGNNKAAAGNWPTTLTDAVYGNSTDLWGASWTSADINNANFGVVISAIVNGSLTGRFANIDYMTITIYYTPATSDTTPPICTVDYLDSFALSNPITYINAEGYFTTYGAASDADSGFVNSAYPVSVNRTSPGTTNIWTWVVADDASQNPDWNTIIWNNDFPTSAGRNDYYVNGEHTICCKAADSAGNVYMGGCKKVCIDTQDPVIDSISNNIQDCDDDSETYYSDSSCVTWSWTAHDVGCAGIDYYVVKLYDSENNYITMVNTGTTSAEFCQLQDGQDYYVTVGAMDNAVNLGNYITSDEVIIDTTDPIVSIDSIWGENVVWYNDEQWIKGDFWVNETEYDLNILDCRFEVADSNGAIQWYVPCDSAPIYVNNNNCTIDGTDTCHVEKLVRDKACNSNNDFENYNVDKHAPTTIKTPEGNYYTNGSLMTYASYLIHYFLGSTSGLSFSGNDNGGVGCNTTYAEVRDSSNALVDSFYYYGCSGFVSMVNEYEDGVYNINYYSVDHLGNTELTKIETDKIDTEAPTTLKTYVGNQIMGWRTIHTFNNLLVWIRFITSDTEITLAPTDTEVGVENTYYQILIPSEADASLCGTTYTQTNSLFTDNFETDLTQWDADYWETHDQGELSSDYGRSNTDTSPAGGYYLWLEDDVSMHTSVNTSGYNNIKLSYDRRTAYTESADRLEVSWKTGDYCNPYDVCGGDSWDVDGDGIYGCSACEWNRVDEYTGGWDYVEWILTGAENSNIQIAFWLDNGESDVGRVDNVTVTGDKQVPNVVEGLCEWYCHNGNNNGTWYEEVQEGKNCTPTIWTVDQDATEDTCYARQWEPKADNYPAGFWCNYNEPITGIEDCDHKICYFSDDSLGNVEEVKCQVFSVDNKAPKTYIINPDESYIDGKLQDACLMPLDVSLSDEKAGVASAYATLTDDSNDEQVWSGNLTKYISLPDGEERWYYPNSVDLTGLPAGEYLLKIYSYDKIGNEQIKSDMITLDEGLFIPANWIKGCNVGVNGGTCNLQFTACARGITDMNFSMSKLFDKKGGIELASLADLNPRLVTNVDNGLVGFISDTGSYPGEITSLGNLPPCAVINDRVKFNVTLTFTPELIQNIGTGTYYFDWATNSYRDYSGCST